MAVAASMLWGFWRSNAMSYDNKQALVSISHELHGKL